MKVDEQTAGTQLAGTETRPMTSDEHAESLRDGLGSRLYGESVTIHPFFGEGRMP